MRSKDVLSPFPLRPLYPSLWLAAPTPRLYKKHPLRPSRARTCVPPPDPITDPTVSQKRELRNSHPFQLLHLRLPHPPPPPFGLMDRPPSRTLDSPRQSRRRGTTPSISETPHPSQPAPVSGSTTTPLPSIRHLHPHLPPPNQYFGPSDHSAHPSSFEHPPQSGPVRYGTQPGHYDPTKALDTIDESDSDKHSSPPPKKRRKRQALSCTGQ